VTTDTKVNSFRIGREYTVGQLPTLTRVRWWIGNSPMLTILGALIVLLIIGLLAYWLLSRLTRRRLARRAAP